MSRIETYEKFKAQLLSGAVKPGQFVTQRELADLAGVPLGAAREAIQRLEHEHLLRVFPQRGIQVADCTVDTLRDAFEYRQIMELHAVAHYAENARIEDIQNLEASTREILQRVTSGDVDPAVAEDAVEIDWRMHDDIIDSLNNEVLRRDYQINAARIRLMRVNNRLDSDRLVTALTEHLGVLEAAGRRDAAGAVAALKSHLGIAKQRALTGR